jgi:hypothetical protein
MSGRILRTSAEAGCTKASQKSEDNIWAICNTYVFFDEVTISTYFPLENNPQCGNNPLAVGKLGNLVNIVALVANQDRWNKCVEGYVMPTTILYLPNFGDGTAGNILWIFLDMRCNLRIRKILRVVCQLGTGERNEFTFAMRSRTSLT